MQIKAILLLITGAVAVLAQSGTDEGDINTDELQSLLYDRTETESTIAGSPTEEKQDHLNVNPTYSQVPQVSEVPLNDADIKVYTAQELRDFYKNIQSQLRQVQANTKNHMNNAYNETHHTNNALRQYYETWVRSLKVLFSKNIKKAVKQGKDETKIQACINKRGEYFLFKYANELHYARDCDDAVANLTSKILFHARDSYSDAFKKYIHYELVWSTDMGFCHNDKNNRCIAEGLISLERRFKNFAAQSNWWAKFVQEASRKHRILQDICYQDFLENLKQYRVDYLSVLKQCVPEAEIPESEVKEEGLLPNSSNVTVVPEAQV